MESPCMKLFLLKFTSKVSEAFRATGINKKNITHVSKQVLFTKMIVGIFIDNIYKN